METKMKMTTNDLTTTNIDAVGKLFPNCITEAKSKDGKLKKVIDFEKLKQELSEDVLDGHEAYEFNWVGKKAAMVEANKPTTNTLRPNKEDSVNWDNTENLYIEGDNLEVLKLLQESYLGKVKMIYIDPPYNTGNDFLYKDDFKQSREDYEEDSGETDDEGNRYFRNTDSNGRFHSVWCSNMYSRLKVAKNLLMDDGVVAISIDENEKLSLMNLCNEIYGEKNVDELIWQKMDSRYDKNTNSKIINRVKSVHESIILCYKCKSQTLFDKVKRLPEWKNKQNNPDNDPRGPWQSGIISFEEGHAKEDRNSPYYYSVETPSGKIYTRHWFVLKEEFDKLRKDNRISFPKNGEGVPRIKTFENEEQLYKCDSILRGFGTSSSAKNEIEEIFGNRDLFDTPKPLKLIKELIRLISDKNSLIMDFFSGSATTAHAVMQLNVEDVGDRKFIMVQYPEDTSDKSEAYKSGYKNICEIGKERICRAAMKIHEKNPEAKFDDGFRNFYHASSNMKKTYYSSNDYSKDIIELTESNIKEDRTDLDLLFQCLLDWGLPISKQYKSEKIDGFNVHFYDEDALVACFDEDISEDCIKEIAKRKPLRVVFRDRSFKDSPSKINVEETFKMLSPKTTVKVI